MAPCRYMIDILVLSKCHHSSHCWDLNNVFAYHDAGLSYVEDQLAFLYMDTVGIIIMLARTCQGLCKHRSSLGTWLASVMVSSLCSAWLDSELLCFLFVIYTDPSSVSSTQVECHFWIMPFGRNDSCNLSTIILHWRLGWPVFEVIEHDLLFPEIGI